LTNNKLKGINKSRWHYKGGEENVVWKKGMWVNQKDNQKDSQKTNLKEEIR
jgi:hypothetical protein